MVEVQAFGIFTEGTQDINIIGPTRRDLKDYQCSICLLVLNKPHLTECCGHHFCERCLDAIKAAHKPCPMCKVSNVSSILDRNMERELLALTVECTAKEEGCNWTGELRQLKRHTEGECNFTEVECRWKCGEKLQRKRISQHEESSCPKRPWYTHFECPDAKDLAQKVEQLESSNIELATQVETLQSSNGQLTAQVETLQSSNGQLTAQVETLQSSNGQLTAQVETLQSSNHQLTAHVETLANNLRTLTIESERKNSQFSLLVVNLSAKLDAVTVEAQHKDESSTRKVEATKEIDLKSPPRMLEQQLSDMSLSNEIPVCPFTLKMNKFSSRKTDGGSWSSRPFYSNANGYKMCILVYANGALEGKNTHVSIYVYLMRGVFDDDLKWPFHGKVNVTLLNQMADSNHHERPVEFPTNTEASKRVTTSNRSRHGLGFADYILFGDLQSEDSEAQYLKDDCLTFAISVEVYQASSIASKIPIVGKLFSGK